MPPPYFHLVTPPIYLGTLAYAGTGLLGKRANSGTPLQWVFKFCPYLSKVDRDLVDLSLDLKQEQRLRAFEMEKML